MKRIGFVGVPGSGKSALARGLAAKGFDILGRVELVSEYARRYISKYSSIDDITDQYRVTQKQIEWEDAVPEKDTDTMITDNPIPMGFLYALDLVKHNNTKDIVFFNDLFKIMNKTSCPPRYDVIFHIPPTWKPSKDGVRPDSHYNEEWRKEADDAIKVILKMFPPANYHRLIADDMEDRLIECLSLCQGIGCVPPKKF